MQHNRSAKHADAPDLETAKHALRRPGLPWQGSQKVALRSEGKPLEGAGTAASRTGRGLSYTRRMTEVADTFDSAFTKAVDLGNRLADRDKDADLWDIADGLLAGALQYWLYSRQPCGDPRCQDCMPISTAEGRMAELKRLMEQLAAESEYFHTPTDANAGRA
jgi:hypothetical protein